MEATKPSKHTCPDCGRAYKAAETMNRHRKNHSASTAYTCQVCDASFKRKDLLDRHSQIHVQGRPTTNRKRGQRACDRCSRLKTRCDNMTPCTRCSRAGHDCTYKSTRSRARTDRSSASTTSSALGSPQMTAEELNTLVEEYCSSSDQDGSSTSHTTTPAPDDSWIDNILMEDHNWQWPEIDAVTSSMMNESLQAPQLLNCPTTGDSIDPTMMLDPALDGIDLLGQHPQRPSNLYSVSGSSFSWLQTPSMQSSNLHVEISSSNSTDLAFPDNHPNEKNSTAEGVIEDLASLSISSMPMPMSEAEQELFWAHQSSKVENTSRLHNIVPHGSHLLKHFQHLFFKSFPVNFPQRQESFHPHLYLTLTAIGAAYAGPVAKIYHERMLSALRPRLLQAAMEEQLLPNDTTLPLIQSLALHQSSMLLFGDRQLFTFGPKLRSVMMSLSRQIDLFNPAKYSSPDMFLGIEADTRRRLAHGVARLDAFVTALCGLEGTLVSEEEGRACRTRKDDEVMDRLWKTAAQHR